MNTFININSKIAQDIKILEQWSFYAFSRINFLTHTWERTPVYLVDPDVMDKVYPPERRVFIDEDCLEELLGLRPRRRGRKGTGSRPCEESRNAREKGPRKDRKITHKDLEECRRESATFTAMGVYLSTWRSNVPVPGIEYPCIFICPERIKDTVDNILRQNPKGLTPERGMNILFANVLFHELAHGFMDKNPNKPYGEIWSRTIEESLATHLAWARFTTGEKWIVNRMIQGQPLEYRGCTFWQEVSNFQAKALAGAWSEYGELGFEDLIRSGLFCFGYGMRHPRHFWDIEEFLYHYMRKPEMFWSEIADRILQEVISY